MQTVRIMNPAHGERWTTIKRAQAYVDQGRAVWCSRPSGLLAIRFHKDHPLDTKVRAMKPVPAWDGYDRRRAPLTQEEQDNVPLIKTQLPVHQRPRNDARGRRWPKGRNGRVRVLPPESVDPRSFKFPESEFEAFSRLKKPPTASFRRPVKPDSVILRHKDETTSEEHFYVQ